MLKVRVQGTVEDIYWFRRFLEKHTEIQVSKKELSAVLNKVTSLILWVPFFVALIYLWIGIFISERYVIVSNVPVAFGCTVVLLILQTGIYLGINTSYRKAVFRKVYSDYERN